MMKPIVWTIAGSDSSGGAGIQADLATFHYLNVHGASVITAITAQNSQQITDIHYVAPPVITAQINTLQRDLPPKVIKIGMLGHANTIEQVIYFLKNYSPKVVLDPVMIASSGKALFIHSITKYIQQLIKLFPYIDLLTPNIPEVEAITGEKISTNEDIVRAANILLSLGVKSVLIKGGHAANTDMSADYWTNGREFFWITSPRYAQKNYRGTGCVFSSAVTAALALSYDIKDAIVIAKMYINRGIRLAQPFNANTALLTHGPWPQEEMDLPYVFNQSVTSIFPAFPRCGSSPLGLYPIVDSVEWIKKLLALGVKTIQLRIKNKIKPELEKEIIASIQLAKQYDARLFINDYWELAIACGAYGVHLGQEDLAHADIEKIHQAGLRLGVSTHCYYEVARAHALTPSYIACGPIFPTTSKKMSFSPQGISALKQWRRTLNSYPLVAIGGIDREKIHDVLATGVEGIAMISAITQAKDPVAEVKTLLGIFHHDK